MPRKLRTLRGRPHPDIDTKGVVFVEKETKPKRPKTKRISFTTAFKTSKDQYDLKRKKGKVVKAR